MSIAARRLQRAGGMSGVLPSAYLYRFDGGSLSAAVSTSVTGAGDRPWDAVGIGSGAALVYDDTHVSHGSLSAKLTPAANSTVMRWTFPSASLQGAFRYYVWWDANPTVDTTILWLGSDTATKVVGVNLTTTGIFRFYGKPVGSLYSTPAATLPLGGWARVEIAYTIDSATPTNGQLRCAVYAGDSTTALADSGWITGDLGTLGVTYVRVGKYATEANTTPHWIDSIAYSETASNFLGPITGGNMAPIAHAGPDQSVATSSVVTLNGAGSSDPDGSIASYAWTQVSGTSVTLSSASAAQPTFTAPGSAGNLTFSLTVTDNSGASSTSDTVTITVTSVLSPIADAGALPLGTANYTIPGGAVFVATTGSDTSGSGTQANPYQTFAKAVTAVPSGGTIVMRGGSYNEGEDTQDQAYPTGISIQKSITVQNYPGEAVWFDGSAPVGSSWTQSGATWSTPYDRLFNRSPTNADGQDDGWGAGSGAGGYWVDYHYPQSCWPDMVFYDGVQLEQVASLAEVAPGKFYVAGATTTGKWFQATTLHIGDDPSGHEVCYANKAKLATLAGTSYSTTFRGVGFRRYASYHVAFGALYVQHALTLENVWAEDMSATFIHLDSAPSTSITKLSAYRMGFNVIGSNLADNIVIDRADMREANYAKFNVFGPSVCTIKLNKCQYVTVKNSIFKDSYSSGFWVDSTCNTPILVNSLFENLTNRPIDLETASDGIVANCKFINNGADTIFINDSDTCRLYNNTFAENNWGARGTGGDSGTASSPNVVPWSVGQSSRRYDNSAYSFNYDSRLGTAYYTDFPQHQWTINYITICNNVIARPGANMYAALSSNNAQDSFRVPTRTFVTDMHPTMNGNVYHWPTIAAVPPRFPDYPWICANGYQVAQTIYYYLSTFQSGTGLDANSSYTTSDPLDANYEVTNTTYHTNAVGLPGDIALLIGQATGSKHCGAYW